MWTWQCIKSREGWGVGEEHFPARLDPKVNAFSYLSLCMTAVSFSYWTYSFLVGMGHTTPLWQLALPNGWREWQRDSELICSCQIPVTLLAVRILKFSVFLSDLIIFSKERIYCINTWWYRHAELCWCLLLLHLTIDAGLYPCRYVCVHKCTKRRRWMNEKHTNCTQFFIHGLISESCVLCACVCVHHGSHVDHMVLLLTWTDEDGMKDVHVLQMFCEVICVVRIIVCSDGKMHPWCVFVQTCIHVYLELLDSSDRKEDHSALVTSHYFSVYFHPISSALDVAIGTDWISFVLWEIGGHVGCCAIWFNVVAKLTAVHLSAEREIRTHTRFRRTLVIRTKHNMWIFRVTPFTKLLNDIYFT